MYFFFIFFTYFKNVNCYSCSQCYYVSGSICTQDREIIQTFPSIQYSYALHDFCNTNCRPRYSIEPLPSCSQCTITPSYYTITESNVCLIDTCIGNKIIEHTLECTDRDLKYLYKLEDFYYVNQPPNTQCQNKICSCASPYYFVTNLVVYDKKKITCHARGSDPYKYYNKITHELYTQCPIEMKYMKKGTVTDTPFMIRCSESCEPSEYILEHIRGTNPEIIEEYCVDNCQDELHYTGISSTYKYEYIDNGVKKCLKDCSAGTFKLQTTSGTVSKWSCVTLDKCDYYVRETSTCYSSCIDPSINMYHNFGSKECITSCDQNNYLYADTINKICHKKEECNFIDEINTPKLCLRSCLDGNNKFHDHDSISCIAACGQEKEYYANGEKICYSSCSDIPGDYKFEDKDLKICYQTRPGLYCNYYYKKADGIFKCSTLNNCLYSIKYKYLLGDECRPNCEGYYQIEITSSNYIRCFETLEIALNYNEVKYCDISQKKCWSTFPNDGPYYINDTYTISTVNKYELVRECRHFYYKDFEPLFRAIYVNWCIDNCMSITGQSFFVRGNKKCLTSCKDVFILFFDDANNECLESCELRPLKQFAYPIPNTPYSDTPTKCLSSCDINNVDPGRYYNYDSHICLFKCNWNNNKYIYSKYPDSATDLEQYKCYPSCLSIIDVDRLNNPNYLSPRVFKYADIDDVCHETRPNVNCGYYYTLSDGVKKCALAQDCQNLNFYYLRGEECMIKCDDNYYELKVEGSDFIKCYSSPSECLEGEGVSKIFYSNELMQCYKDYQPYLFVKYEEGNKYELVSECTDFYYYNDEDGFNYCKESCYLASTAEKQFYFLKENKKCEESCSFFNKYYYDPTNHECLDYCSGRSNMIFALPLDALNHPEPCIAQCPSTHPYYIDIQVNNAYPITKRYECVSICPFYTDTTRYELLDIKTKECRERCLDSEYTVANGICYPKCDVANNYKFINSDTYECVQACPSELKSEVRLGNTNVYLCKSLCERDEFRYRDECVEKCPETHNFIGYNNICKEKCDEDANGKYYYPVNEVERNTVGYYPIYKCISSCSQAIESNTQLSIPYRYYEESHPYKCLENCPAISHYYLESNSFECLSSCPYNFPYYDGNEGNSIRCQENTICPYAGPNIYFLDGQCVSLETCYQSSKNFVDSRNICLDECPESDVVKKIEDFHEGSYKCLRNCPANEFILQRNPTDPQECIDHCPYDMNFIGKDRFCKSSCSDIDGIFYYKVDDTQTKPGSDIKYIIYKCVDACKEDNVDDPNERGYELRLANDENNGRECYQDCPNNYYLSMEEKLCYHDCLYSNKNPFTLPEGICAQSCEQSNTYHYWGENKNCVLSCNEFSNTKLVDTSNNKCVEKCNISSYYRYELDGYCVSDCDTPSISPNKLRYSLEDYICKEKCEGDEYLSANSNNICIRGGCADDEFLYVTDNGENTCVSHCPGDKKFYYKNDRVCLPECNTGDKAVEGENNCVNNCKAITNNDYYYYKTDFPSIDEDYSTYDKCVLDCPPRKPYINEKYTDENICVDICPANLNKYFVDSDNVDKKRCLYDCPKEYPFYTIEINDPNNVFKNKYKCQEICHSFFAPNVDEPSLVAKQCLTNCPDPIYPNYKFQIINETENTKKCYTECPPETKYRFEAPNADNNCYEKCPRKAPYHITRENICKKITEFNDGFILYDTKEWDGYISACPVEYPYKSITEVGDEVTICLKECNFEYFDENNNDYILYSYLTPYDTCVINCETSPSVIGKFLKHDEQTHKCICKNKYYKDTNSQIQCFPENINHCKNTPNYPLPLNNTKECLAECNNDRILNPSEDECFEKDTPCSYIASYTELIITDEGQKKCDCSYKYYYNQDKKICLGEKSVCPSDKHLYIPETMECINSCPLDYPYQFKNFCLKNCPSYSIANELNVCICNNFWYEIYPGNYECHQGNCLEGYPVYVEPTMECLQTCKGSQYKYFFENKCYNNCSFIHNLEGMDMPVESPFASLADFKCDCKGPWYYDVNNNNIRHCPDNTIKTCRDYTNLNLPFMIDSTNQCVEKCPPEYPYYFNHKCFTSCESANEIHKYNIEKVEGNYECVCPNLWKIDPEDRYEQDKICIDKNKNECPPYPDNLSTTYLILRNKQCVDSRDKCPSDTFKFNFVCYDKCPEFTIKGKKPFSDNNIYDICVCDKDSYRWLDYEKYGNIYYQCGLDTCPDKFIVDEKEYIRRIFLENENKCVRSCLEDGSESNAYKYSFRGKCVLECPIKTKLEYDECVFIDVNNETEIDSLDKLKEAANVQAKELYEKSGKLSGFLMNKFDASLQIYSVNRSDLKSLTMKSNLTYIDLGTCLDKIYSDNNLNDSEKILISKYDLLTRMHKNNEGNNNNDNTEQISADDRFLINQVEYEFYLESTMEKIEGSICSPYEIQISYPIFFNKNKFNNFATGFNENNYLKKFKMGKELYEKDLEADSFNKDNKIYKDQCYGVEINGKDIVFEERYNILYPNNISLCESNCTMNNTDFDLERINCMCTYKEIFDFYRVDQESNDILHDPNFELPLQSKANVEIIKCFNQMEFKRDLLKNEAFYFSSVVALIQVVTAVVSVLQGVKVVSSFTQGMFNLNGAKVNIKGNNKSNVVSLCSTNRLMNNPPRKGNNGKDDDELDEENKKNIVVKKNNVINNNHPIRVLSKYDGDDNSNSNMDYNPSNYNPYSRPNFPKNKKRINLIDENENKTRVFSINNKSYNVNIFQSKKAEFIPPQYNFKFFKPTDKGVVKQIPRSQISFKIWPSTKYLLEMKKDVQYGKNYLKGPFYEDQNIIEIIDENGTNSNQTIKINNDDMIEGSDSSNIPIAKKVKNIFRNSDLFKRDDYYDVKKRTISYNINKQPKNLINVRKISPIRSLEPNTPIEDYEMKKEQEMQKVDNITSIYTLMKREHTYLRMSYEFYLSKIHPGVLPTILAEICDKIYLIKTLVLLKKFEVTSVYISLYIFYHILLLSLLCGFFTINTIKKIWTEDNFPNIRFYLLYGFLANIIDWVFYKIFIILLDNQDRIRSLVKLNEDYATNKTSKFTSKENEDGMNNEVISTNNQLQQKIEEKYDELMKKIKIQLAIFYIVNFLLTLFFFMYLTSFFAIYTGTKKLVLKAYYISIIEIVIIKFVYGLCLGSLRIAAEVNKFKTLYNFVYICDKYLA